MTLVPVVLDRCPCCGSELTTLVLHEDALLWHGGHGATRSTTHVRCRECDWSLVTDVSETRPPRNY